MATAKTNSLDELKKMSSKDRSKLLTKAAAELAHYKLHVRAGEDKQSHKIRANKVLIARILTLNNLSQNEK